jgi:DNA invertase Pin-like site-specific DNA recombinase
MATPPPFPPGSSLFAYLRDSGHEDQELSIEQQERHIRQWCTENNLILAKLYPDAACPGSSTVHRDQLQAMMHDLRRGAAVAGVVIWKWSRFARNADDAQLYRSEIRARGYLFHSLNDVIPEGPIGKIFEAILDYKDEQYLADLSIDVQRGLRDLVQQYGCVPGTPPRGFLREPVIISYHRDGSPRSASHWRPAPDLVPAVQKAFEMYAAGATVGSIHRELHLYSAINSYHTFWSNKLYIGILQYGDLTIIDYCEPLIPRSIWDACQERLECYAGHRHVQAGSKNHPRRVNSPFLLSGLARCARCGSPLFGRTSHQRNGSILQAYSCSRAYRNRDCFKHRIPRQAFENAVLGTLTDYILRPDTLQAARQLLIEGQAGALEEHRRQMTIVNGHLAKLRRQIQHVTAAIAAAGHSHALLARLADLETQETALLQRRAELETAAVAPILPLDLALLPAAIAALREQSDPQTLRTVLNAFIDHVDVQRDGNQLTGTIYYFLPPDLKKAIPPPDSGGTITVPTSSLTPGAPSYRHSIPFPFCVPARNKN